MLLVMLVVVMLTTSTKTVDGPLSLCPFVLDVPQKGTKSDDCCDSIHDIEKQVHVIAKGQQQIHQEPSTPRRPVNGGE